MEIKIVVFESHGHSSLTGWQERVGSETWSSDLWTSDPNNLVLGDENVLDKYWEEAYKTNISHEFSRNVEPSVTVASLISDLINWVDWYRNHKRIWLTINRAENIPPDEPLTEAQLELIPSGRRLKYKASLEEEGIKDGDLLGLMLRYHTPFHAMMGRVATSAEMFRRISSQTESPPQANKPYIWGALLYTDDDKELATYVRKHIATLNVLSGNLMGVFVIEKHQDDLRLSLNYWKEFLQEKFFIIWSTMGWLSTKPYDKNQAYEIASKLGVYPDQLPCLVLFDNLARIPKLVFPIVSPSTDYFRKLFSSLYRSLDSNKSDKDFDILEKQYKAIIEEIIRDQPTEIANDRTQYNFYGETVFINRPKGQIDFSDFQNK